MTPTPHIAAKKGDFAKTVLMPGDPLRSKLIAEKFLTGRRLVNDVRGVQGYTGLYKGNQVSVMASGMGMPSMGIYSYELFHFYDVDSIIRIGSAGGISENVKLRDILIGMAVCTNSNFEAQFQLTGKFSPIANFDLVEKAVRIAKEKNLSYKVGNLLSSDVFYDDVKHLEEWKKMGVLGVEMESAALYLNAARANKNALCICTVSDCPLLNQSLSSEQRQNSFLEMMELSLEVAIG